MVFFIICLIFLTGLFYFTYSKRKLINNWRKYFQIDKHQAIFDEIFSQVSGYSLSRDSRKQNDSIEYTYGEIEFESFIALLSLCHPNSKTVFYDLGSGTGKAVLACAMVYKVQQAYGIELFPLLHQSAEKQLVELAKFSEYTDVSKHIRFINDNFINFNLDKASLIFINSTTYVGELWNKISKHLESVAPEVLVISTSKPLSSKQFAIKTRAPVQMSWGIVDAYIQQRK